MERKIYDRQISKQGMSGISRREEQRRGVRERGRERAQRRREGDEESGVEKGMRERGKEMRREGERAKLYRAFFFLFSRPSGG